MSSERLVLLFPGQGAQYPCMGAELYRSDQGRQVFDRASEALGWDVAQLCLEGPPERLNLTAYTQPAILTVSYAAWTFLAKRGVRPWAAAGLSLGEFSALAAAGALTLEEAVVLVHRRGKFMQEAVEPGVGGMAAVIGVDAPTIEECCLDLERKRPGRTVRPANYNCPGQVVISGHLDVLEQACEKLLALGAKRAVTLPVSAPFHSPLLAPAADRLADAMSQLTFRTPAFPVMSNVTARPHEPEPARIQELLVQQVTSPVRWEQSMRSLLDQGAGGFIELGPGKTLAGFLRRMDRSTSVWSCESPETIDEVAIS